MGDDAASGHDAGWSRDVAASAPIEITFTDLTTNAPPDEPSGRPNRWRAAAGATAAVAVLAGVLITLDGSDDEPTSAPEPTAESGPTTMFELPAVPTSADPSDGRPEDDADGAGDRIEPFEPTLPVASETYSALPRVWRNGTIAVPPTLPAVAPMTVVVLDASGMLREIDLPSGRTRDIDTGLEPDSFTQHIAVGRSSTLVATPGDGTSASQSFSVFEAGERPVAVTVPLGANRFQERPGTDEYVGLGVDFAASSLEQLTIHADGSLDSAPVGFGPALARGVLRFGPTGLPLVLDGGGVFRRQPDGTTTLIAEGELVSASSHHVLSRNCTAEYVCTGVLIDGTTGERSDVRLDPDFVPSLASGTAQVSPDGRWLRYSSTDLEQADRVLDLSTGAVTSLSSGSAEVIGTHSNDVWAPDSSGFFRTTDGTLEFYSVASGEVVAFTDGPTRVADFGVRLDITGTPEPPIIEDPNPGPDLQLVAIDENGSFHDLDLASGQVTTYPSVDVRTLFGRTIVLSNGSDAFGLASSRGPSARLDRSAGTSEEVDDPDELAVHRGPKNNTAWRPNPGDEPEPAGAEPTAFRLFDVDGTDLGLEVVVPAGMSVVGGDVSGGLVVVDDTAGISLLRDGSTEVLTASGDVLGIGSRSFVVRECETGRECQPTRIDRATGARSPVGVPQIAEAQAAFANGFGLIVENTVSPDGEVLIGPTTDGPLGWIITDLADGTVVDIESIRTGSRIVWTPDSGHAVFQSGDALFVFDRAAAQVVELTEAPPIVGFTVR